MSFETWLGNRQPFDITDITAPDAPLRDSGVFAPAIAFNNLGISAVPDINSATDAASYTTFLVPPSSGLILAVVFTSRSGALVTPTISGNNITWTQIGSTFGYGSSSQRGLSLFAANASGGVPGTTTIDLGGNTHLHCIVSFVHVTGVDLSGGVAAAFVQQVTNNGSGTSGSVTLAAATHANNRAFAAFEHVANEASTQRTNWFEADDLAGSGGVRNLQTQWRPDAFETTASASWASSVAWGGMAVELKALVVAAVEENMEGSSAGSATGDGTLAAIGYLVGSSAGVATASGDIKVVLLAAGSSSAAATVSGTLVASGYMVATSTGAATDSGTLAAIGSLTGSATGIATTSGDITGQIEIAGSTAGAATGSGTLTQASAPVLAYAQYVEALAPANLLAYWPLYDSFINTSYADSGSHNLDGSAGGVANLNDDGALYLPGQAGYVNIYHADLDTLLDMAEHGAIIRAKVANVGVWSDGLSHRTFKLQGHDADNSTTIRILTNGDLIYRRWGDGGAAGEGNGTQSVVQVVGLTDTDWMTLAYSVSETADTYKAFKDGTQQGTTQTGLGEYAGPLDADECVIGATSTASGDVWHGWLKDFIMTLNGVVPSDSDQAAVHTALDADTLTAPDLDTLFGSGNWVWWQLDDRDVDEFSGNGSHAKAISVTPGADGIGDGNTAFTFAGTASYVNIWSPDLRDSFDENNFTLSVWFYADASVWTDATQRAIFTLQADANNRILIYKRGGANDEQIQFLSTRGGTNKTVNHVFSGSGWHHVAVTVGGGVMKAWVDGVQSGSNQTAIGTWTGDLSLTNTVLGAAAVPATGVWNGRLAHAAIWNTALDATAIAEIAQVIVGSPGTSAGSAAVSGTLVGTGYAVATASGAAVEDATLRAVASLTAAASGAATVSGTLAAPAILVGSAAGSATTAGHLHAKLLATATAAGISTTSGTLLGAGYLAGTAAGVATVSATAVAGDICTPRSAAINYALPFGRVLPCPNNIPEQGDRARLVFLYPLPVGAADALAGSAAGSGTASGSLVGVARQEAAAAGLATVTATLRATGYLAAVASGEATVSGDVLAAVLLEGSAAGVAADNATLYGVAGLAGAADGLATVSGTLSAAAPLQATEAGSSTASGTLRGLAALEGTAAGQATVSGTAESDFALSGLIAGTATATATLQAIGYLRGQSDGAAAGSGNLVFVEFIIGSAAGSATATGSLQGQIRVVGAAAGVASLTGTLEAFGTLVGSSAGLTTVSATARAIGYLEATLAGVATVAGTLRSGLQLAATAAGSATGSATLRAAGYMEATAAGVATGSASLVFVEEIVGSAQGSATASGTLHAVVGIAAMAAGSGVAAATLRAIGYLEAASAGSSTAIARPSSDTSLAATTGGSATVSGTMQATGRLAAVAAGVGDGSGTLSAVGYLVATLSVAATVSGTLSSDIALAGAAAGQSSVQATLLGVGYLTTNTAGTATAQGTLRSPLDLSGEAGGAAVVVGAIIAIGYMSAQASGTSTAILVVTQAGFVERELFRGMFRGMFKVMA